ERARRAHREILFLCNTLPSADASNRIVLAACHFDRVAEIQGDEKRFEQMTTIVATSRHMQEEIELGRRCNSQIFHRGSMPLQNDDSDVDVGLRELESLRQFFHGLGGSGAD